MPRSFIDKQNALDNATPVASTINRYRNNTKFNAFRSRMIQDEAFLNHQDEDIQPETKEQWQDPDFGMRQFKTWQPALLYKAIMARLTDLAPFISAPDVNNPIVRGANEDLEYFLNGALKMINDQFEERGQPNLISQISYQAAMRGFICGRAMMVNYKPYDEEEAQPYARPEIEVWDAKDTIWAMDGRGALWGATRCEIPVSKAKDILGSRRASEMGNDGMVEVWKFVDRKYYAVLFADGYGLAKDTPTTTDEEDVQKTPYLVAPRRHGLVDKLGRSKCPFFAIQVGARFSTPTNDVISRDEAYRHIGESIFGTGYKEQVQLMNTLGEYWLEQVADRAKTQKVYASDKHSKAVNEALEEGASTIDISPQERIEAIQFPVDRSAGQGDLLELQLRQLIQGTSIDIPTDSNASGYAISLLQQSTNRRLLPYQEAIASAYRIAFRMLKDHFQTGAFGDISMFGESGSDGSTFERDISSAVIGFATSFNVKMIEPNRLTDPAYSHSANQLFQTGLISRHRIMRSVLNIADPDKEVAQILREQAGETHPLIRPAVMAEAFAAIGEFERADVLGRDVERTRNFIEETAMLERLQRLNIIPLLLYSLYRTNPQGAAVAVELAQRLGIGGIGQDQGTHQKLIQNPEMFAELLAGQITQNRGGAAPAGDNSTPAQATGGLVSGGQPEAERNQSNAVRPRGSRQASR